MVNVGVSHARRASRLAEGQPSATAQLTASLRAAHQLVDHRRIFDDPLALRIIGAQAEAAVRARASIARGVGDWPRECATEQPPFAGR
jgi:hypothetical protein